MKSSSARILISATLAIFVFAGTSQAEPRKVADLPKDREVKYSADIYPMLKKNCFACHNTSRDEGGVNLESVEKMLASDVEDILVKGKPDGSRLFVVAAHIEDPIMPPEDNEVAAAALSPEELALLKRWIETGANVDNANPGHVQYEWQPLPPNLKTVYASTITPDGRMAASSFGNRIRVFGTSASSPIASVQLPPVDGKPTPPHLDFVQDLTISDDGRRLVSSGFRNVKIWRMNSLSGVPAPSLDADQALATAVDVAGKFVASVSLRGEVNVGPVGKQGFAWMKAIELPGEFAGDQAPKLFASVAAGGEAVAVAWANQIRIVRVDGKAPVALTSPQPATSIAYDRTGRLIVGDATGAINFWVAEGDSFKPITEKYSDKPVERLLLPTGDAALIAIDAAGKVGIWHGAETKIKEAKQLPAAVSHVAALPGGSGLWTTLANGAFGQFDFATSKLNEKSKLDPAMVDQYAQVNWTNLVGERLVAATEAELKTAQTNEASEKKNVENSVKDIEAKTKARDEKANVAADTKKKADEAKAKLTAEQTKQKDTNTKRTQLTEKIKQIDAAAPVLAKEKEAAVAAAAATAAKIVEMQKQVAAVEAELKKKMAEMNASVAAMTKTKAAQDQTTASVQKKIDDGNAAKAAADKELKALPAANALEAAVKAANDAFDKANKEAEAKGGDHKKAVSALELANETKTRADNRLKQSTEEVANRQKLVEQAKAEQAERVKKDAEVKALQDKSLGADQALAVLGGGQWLLAQSSTSGSWNLWSASGDWISAVPEIPTGSQMLGSSDGGVLVRIADGQAQFFQMPQDLYIHERSIGSATGESPFADRVLAVAIDPAGKLLATGGGEPSRSGELMIWDLEDGSLIRKFENPHTDTILCIKFSPDGKTLATSSADRMVKLWNLETGALKKTLEGHTHHVNGIAWNVNNRELSSASADSTVKVWNVDTGQATRTITGLSGELTRLVYVGRDGRVGFVSGDNMFRVYRTDNGGRETQIKLSETYLYALDANRDGTKFVLGGADGIAKIVDKAGKELVKYE